MPGRCRRYRLAAVQKTSTSLYSRIRHLANPACLATWRGAGTQEQGVDVKNGQVLWKFQTGAQIADGQIADEMRRRIEGDANLV